MPPLPAERSGDRPLRVRFGAPGSGKRQTVLMSLNIRDKKIFPRQE